MTPSHYVGERISYDGALCTVRYIGEVAGTNGSWLGVEWDDATRGKHDGSHKGVRYFRCVADSATAASMVRPTRPFDAPRSFVTALREKYAPDEDDQAQEATKSKIVFSGKVAEEYGFDKIRRKLAQVQELKVIILDGQRVGWPIDGQIQSLQHACPKLSQLDLSRNLFERLGPVIEICRNVPLLSSLTINGNRFQNVLEDDDLERAQGAFSNVKELSIDENLLSWDEICHIASKCPSLTSLKAGANQLTSLHHLDFLHLTQTLTSLNLEYNGFTHLSDLSSLSSLSTLRTLHLKGNVIIDIAADGAEAPLFPPSLQFLDVSYNKITSWSFVDQLPSIIPGLTGLRISHNPVYDNKAVDDKASSSEEAHMFTIARAAPLKSLNYTSITVTDRANAEMYYLSRIAKQLATVPESAEQTVKSQHPRYIELCGLYGEPDVIRTEEINPSFLEARLVTVGFDFAGKSRMTVKIPRSFDVYSIAGIAGKLFGVPPLKLKLIWETGEWDPVANFDDEDLDSSDDEDNVDYQPQRSGTVGTSGDVEGSSGRWIKREVELKDGPRQLGYVVDGQNVVIRVEPK